MCTYPARAIIICNADSCPPSPPEVKQCILRGYILRPSIVRIMGVFHQRYAIFHENFEVGIYMQKALHFALRDVYIYITRNFAKSNTICAMVLNTKTQTLCIT